jgi:hypothetical protein
MVRKGGGVFLEEGKAKNCLFNKFRESMGYEFRETQ